MTRPLGYHHSPETIEKLRKSNLGKHNFKHTQIALDKISEASKRLWKQKWYREKMISTVKKPNLGQFKIGFIPWNKGLKLNPLFTGKGRFGKPLRKRIKKDRCVWCGSQERLELDHIKAICNGGTNTEENCQVLCKKCNLKKRDSIDLVMMQLKNKRANSVKG